MNAVVELNLSLLLFLPWYLLIGWLFLRLARRSPRSHLRTIALATPAAGLIAAGIAGAWAYGEAGEATGAIWRQVLACSVGYGAFLAVLSAGFVLLRLSTTATGRG